MSPAEKPRSKPLAAATKKTAAKKQARKQPAAKKQTARKKARAKQVPATQAPGPAPTEHDRIDAAYAARAAAKAGKRGHARERWSFFERMHADVDAPALSVAVAAALAADEAAPDEPVRRRGAGPAPRAFPGPNLNRWVPIGPTVTRRGQAMSRPRASGRIRDIAVSPDGRRAYAASAKGGLWYTGDAGATWAPVGGWATRSVNPQGNGNLASGGALLVDFSGGLAALDVVLFGTGEPTPATTSTGSSAQGGMGVLAALGPTFDPVDADPWEPDSGATLLAGLGVWRLVRHPSATAFSATPGATQDRVLAATTNGLYLGTRSSLPHVAAAPPAAPGLPAQPELPVRDGYTWAPCAAAPPLVAPNTNDVTDAVWLANGATTRIVYALAGTGVFLSDDSGATGVPIAGLQTPGVGFMNRISLTVVGGTSRMYVLAEVNVGGTPTPSLFRVVDALATPPVVVPVGGVPTNLFGDPTTPPTQGWYDHGLAAEVVGGNDRIYLGGSTVYPRNDAEGDWSGSLFCFETPSPPAVVTPLVAVTGISRRNNPPTGDGADINGLVGNNVHADIHAIRLTGPAAPNRQVWVGCDGGVYVSEHAGRINTFAARNNGLATLEPIFVASHPSSSHFLATGFQDNGTQVRVGDTVWEETFEGDGGGTVFHPIRSDVLVTQWTAALWNGAPASAYFDPMRRFAGLAGTTVRENAAAAFYSGAAVVADTATTGRLALGTNRVWITDNLGGTLPLRWRVLPYPPSTTELDARPGGGDPNARQNFGVPNIVNPNFVVSGVSTADQVIDMTWQSGSVLLVIYQGGLVRYTNTNKPAGTWTSQTWPLTGPIPLPANTVMTAVASVPGSLDFYVATLGDPTNTAIETLWFYDDAAGVFHTTGLRRKLDFTGPPVVQGPLDPCYAIVVDPDTPADFYVGTATGVYKGRHTAPTTWSFDTFMNGLPDATVQDLDIWRDPAGAATSPKLLRAGVQSRGLWEVDLARPASRQTYVRVHPTDDRRMLPTPLANPRLRPTAPPQPVFASPDVTIRPAWPLAAPPRFHSTIQSGAVPVYDLWTFQTAFRWLYPSCVPDGRWTDAMRDLVRFHRSVLGLSPGAFIDQTMWRHVVGGTVSAVDRGIRLRPDPIFSENATVTADPADALAVYRAPWQTPLAFDLPATEIDIMESVLPVRNDAGEWTVFREPSTVDVLLHHRDSRPVPAPSAFAVVLWQSAPTRAALLGLGAADLVAFLAGVRAAGIGGVPPALAGGWNVITTAGGSAMQTLRTPLDARLPRAVSVDVDLSGVTSGHRVLVLALVGSLADDAVTAPVGAPATVADLVQAWPHAALRVARVTTRT